MKLLSINSANVSMKSKNNVENNSNKTISGVPLPGTKRLNYSPAAIGAINGLCWASVGMVMEKLVSKIFKTPKNTKLGLAVSGAFGLIMGINAYKFAKNETKQV